jgi:hypothetical protein
MLSSFETTLLFLSPSLLFLLMATDLLMLDDALEEAFFKEL